ncbi:MAG: phosphatase PAP2 family protein [Pseudomonadales bacterium]|nr:phosphatase PAP2 family protein [Pseudomonadales bacterium]
MTRAWLWSFFGLSALVCVFAIPWLDRPLAEWIHGSGLESHWLFTDGTVLLDSLSGKAFSILLPALPLLVLGLLLYTSIRTRPAGLRLIFVCAVQVPGYLLAYLCKQLFGRLRPHELFAGGDWTQAWFAGSDSFPSGHTAFYFGLFLPLAYLFPRWRWPLLVIPFFIAAARMNESRHFLSDVTASMALIALMTLVVSRFLNDRTLWRPLFSATIEPPEI